MDYTPKVFISYSWTSDEHKKWVLNLATKLVEEAGVDVILDQWDLKPGYDRFYFMEESIRNSDKVLIICNQDYCEKSNRRNGGVGIEAQIITPDIYNQCEQEKFIPIALTDEYLMPSYLNSRIAISMIDYSISDEAFEQLKRMVWNVDLIEKPKRGPKPSFASASKVSNKSLSSVDDSHKKGRLKVLFIYAYEAKKGFGHIQSQKLISTLKEDYDVKIAYGICPDIQYSTLTNLSLKNQLISESQCLSENYDYIIIEDRLGISSSTKDRTDKFVFDFLRKYVYDGGILLFLCNETIHPIGTQAYNHFLNEAGLPLIREATSENQFELPHLVGTNNFTSDVLYGYDTDGKSSHGRTYEITIDNRYKACIPAPIRPIYEGVNKLVVNMTLQVDTQVGNWVAVGNKSTKILTSSDLFWDGDICHVFANYKHYNKGIGILFGSNICSDRLCDSSQSDAIKLIQNTLLHFERLNRQRKELMG